MTVFSTKPFFVLLGISLAAIGVKANDYGCPDPKQYYVDLGSNQFIPSLSGSVAWTFEIELGGFPVDQYVYGKRQTVGCSIFGGGGCGLDEKGGQLSTVNWTITAPDSISPVHVPEQILFDFNGCPQITLDCDGHTESINENFPPPATGGGILSIMVASCSSGPDTKLPLDSAEENNLKTALYDQQAECEKDADNQTQCFDETAF